jgi:hypothetical protein
LNQSFGGEKKPLLHHHNHMNSVSSATLSNSSFVHKIQGQSNNEQQVQHLQREVRDLQFELA